MEQSKFAAMMYGKTMTKENIDNMVRLAKNAADAEEKKSALKHSLFFAGQLPLGEKNRVDLAGTVQLLNVEIPYDELESSVESLFSGLQSQSLILKKEDGSYELNAKYEKSVQKARKIAKAYRLEREQEYETFLPKAKTLYRTGTMHYHSGNYEEAFECFHKAVELADYRMASYSLALMYRDGKGVEPSLSEALRYARKALVKGAAIAEPLEREILEKLG